MALIDFTLSNARRFYSSMGNPLGWKGLMISGVLLISPSFSSMQGFLPFIEMHCHNHCFDQFLRLNSVMNVLSGPCRRKEHF